MRHEARECAFKLVFETLFQEPVEETSVEVVAALKKEQDKEFCKQIFDTYLAHKAELEELVSANLQKFELSRVYKIDLALVYVALCEIKYLDTPKAVAINEALEISKKYSTSKSNKFLNGVISAIADKN